MRRLSLLLLFFLLLGLCWPPSALADSAPRPLLRTNLVADVAVPGQVLVLEVTILVPTWMTKPPEFPTFELPDVRVRLPEGASRPASERIEGETWSGVTRDYQISPMIVGRFRIPQQTVKVTFSDPDTRASIVAELTMEEVVFEGRAPVGAEDLDPFIAAEDLLLEQDIEGRPQDLEPGSAFTRTVTARVTGASSIFLPSLIAPLEEEGIAVYPKEPLFSESTNRGVISGERVERVTYVAEAGGRFNAPSVRLRWWNLRTKQIEVAEVPAIEITSRGPPPVAPSAAEPLEFARWLVVGGLLVGLAGAIARWQWPRFTQWRRRRREEKLASESFAFERVAGAMRARSFGDAVRAVGLWSTRLPTISKADRAEVFEPLAPLGAFLYGGEGETPTKKEWSEAFVALRSVRRGLMAREQSRQARRVLPALNPGGKIWPTG